MNTKRSLVLRICLLILLQYVMPGAGLAALTFIISLFQTGVRAKYTRLVSLVPLLGLGVVGVVRAIWFLFLASRADH